MTEYKFIYKENSIAYPDKQVEMTLSDISTWMELQEEFYSFLLGCGFIIRRSDFFPGEEDLSDDSE